MKKSIRSKLFILCCFVAVTGCKARKLAAVTARKPDSARVNADASMSKLNAIRAEQLNFNTFSGRAKAEFDINGKSNDVTMNIRINKGKKIWVSITAIAGIEVARALITPDSILVINKLQGLYLRKPFSYIYRYASPQIDYNSVEALFVGNAIPQLLNEDAKLQADSGNVSLSGNLQDLVYKMIVGPDLKVTETDLSDEGQGQSLHVNNSAFIRAANRELPSQINISSAVWTKKINLNIHYIRADFDQPLEYPFNIPSGYDAAR